MIRRIVMAVMLAMVCMLSMPMAARAFDPFQVNCGAGYSQSAVCSTPGQNPSGSGGVILNIAHIVGYVAGALAVILIIYGAIKYVTANGDSSNTQNAKNTVMYSLVGLVVIMLAEVIINFVIMKI